MTAVVTVEVEGVVTLVELVMVEVKGALTVVAIVTVAGYTNKYR
jgi:hypothetical protein